MVYNLILFTYLDDLFFQKKWYSYALLGILFWCFYKVRDVQLQQMETFIPIDSKKMAKHQKNYEKNIFPKLTYLVITLLSSVFEKLLHLIATLSFESFWETCKQNRNIMRISEMILRNSCKILNNTVDLFGVIIWHFKNELGQLGYTLFPEGKTQCNLFLFYHM